VRKPFQSLSSDSGGIGIDDQSSAPLKAQQLLCEILPDAMREQFLANGFFDCVGQLGVYRISKESQTEIYVSGRLRARACLRLTIPAPSCDRMIAEYLIINNDETLYWSKANIEPVTRASVGFSVLAMFALDLALLLKLVADYLI
jgi:hypothetical protein